jgi:signal transduction histidine kinase
MLTSEQRRHVYLILKESLTNVLRHARATRVIVRIIHIRATLGLEIHDDGVGLNDQGDADATRPLGGRGLPNLKQRALMLGGTARITSTGQGRGTSVMVQIPAVTPHVHAIGSR